MTQSGRSPTQLYASVVKHFPKNTLVRPFGLVRIYLPLLRTCYADGCSCLSRGQVRHPVSQPIVDYDTRWTYTIKRLAGWHVAAGSQGQSKAQTAAPSRRNQ